MKLPGIVLAEQLLASASMSSEHQLLLTSLPGNITFDRVVDELVAQRSKLHKRERPRSFVPKKPCYGYQQNRKRSGKWHGGAFYADEAVERDQPYPYPEDFHEELYEDEESYAPEGLNPLKGTSKKMELIWMVQTAPKPLLRCFKLTGGFLRQEGAAEKGKSFRGPPSAPRHFAVSGSLSLEERKAKIASLKSRTTCRRCGAVGHWSGDSQCPASKGGGRKGRTRSGSVSSSSPPSRLASKGSSSSKQRTVYFAIHEPAPASGSHVYRALRGDGFHAVPPPSSLAGPTGSHAVHETLDEHVPHDALVPAHGSRVPAETRHQWVDLSHGQGCGDVHAEMRGLVHDLPSLYSRPLTMRRRN